MNAVSLAPKFLRKEGDSTGNQLSHKRMEWPPERKGQ